MDFLISLIFGIVIVVFVATVAATGIYYLYRTRKGAAQELRGSPKKKKGIMGPKKTADDWVYLQDEQGLVDLASVPVQPQTRRPVTSPDQVYPPVREQDDFLLESLDMDTPRSAIPPDQEIERRGTLEFSLHYYQLSSTLTITIVSLSDLPLRPNGEPPDTFVELELRYAHEGKVKTEIYSKTCNPHLYESFKFDVPLRDLGSQTLWFRIIDMYEPPVLIGEITVPLVSVAMKRLLSDTELTIIRDIIRLRPRRTPVERPASVEAQSTTSASEPEDTFDGLDLTEGSSKDGGEDEHEELLSEVQDASVGEEVVEELQKALVYTPEVEPDHGGPMLLVSFCYWKPSEKLTVIVMKSKNLQNIEKNRMSDPYVKLYVMMGAKRLKKKKTTSRKRDSNPVWNEAFSFNIPSRIINRVSILFMIKHHSERGRERLLGKLLLGASAADEALDHWNAMQATNKAVARWHEVHEGKK